MKWPISSLVGVGKVPVGESSCINAPMCCGVWNKFYYITPFDFAKEIRVIFYENPEL
jgi:hypothetical protein